MGLLCLIVHGRRLPSQILTWWLYFPLFFKYRYETLKPTEQLEECIPTMKSFAGPISQPSNSRTRQSVEDTAISSVLGIYWNERLHASQSRHYLAKSLQTGSRTKLSSIAEKVWSDFCKCMCDVVYLSILFSLFQAKTASREMLLMILTNSNSILALPVILFFKQAQTSCVHLYRILSGIRYVDLFWLSFFADANKVYIRINGCNVWCLSWIHFVFCFFSFIICFFFFFSLKIMNILNIGNSSHIYKLLYK